MTEEHKDEGLEQRMGEVEQQAEETLKASERLAKAAEAYRQGLGGRSFEDIEAEARRFYGAGGRLVDSVREDLMDMLITAARQGQAKRQEHQGLMFGRPRDFYQKEKGAQDFLAEIKKPILERWPASDKLLMYLSKLLKDLVVKAEYDVSDPYGVVSAADAEALRLLGHLLHTYTRARHQVRKSFGRQNSFVVDLEDQTLSPPPKSLSTCVVAGGCRQPEHCSVLRACEEHFTMQQEAWVNE